MFRRYRRKGCQSCLLLELFFLVRKVQFQVRVWRRVSRSSELVAGVKMKTFMGTELEGPSSNGMLDVERGEKRKPSDGLPGFWLDHMSGRQRKRE